MDILFCSVGLYGYSSTAPFVSYGGHFLGRLWSYGTTVGFHPLGGCPGAGGRMSPSTVGRREKRRLWKAAERARKKIARQQTDAGTLPFPVRKQCSTTFCDGHGTPLRSLRCKHRICEYCIAQLLKLDINRIQFCFTGCKGYLSTNVYRLIRQQAEMENCGPGIRKADMLPQTTAELAHRQAVARAKRIQAGTRVSQKFWVISTEEGAQRQRSRHHVFFAHILGFTEHRHARVQWECSKLDGDFIADPFGIAPILELQLCWDQTFWTLV
eukprot:2591047-Rhodomonas_salina.2